MGAGLCAWATGDVYYTIALEHLDSIPFPSIDDAMYLSLYPPAYIAIGLFVRSRTSTFRGSSWLDGLAARSRSARWRPRSSSRRCCRAWRARVPAAVATNLAYPLADLLLLGVLVTSAALSGWRVDRAWGLIAAVSRCSR